MTPTDIQIVKRLVEDGVKATQGRWLISKTEKESIAALLERVKVLESNLKEAVRLASDDEDEVFKGDLRERESALIKWKRETKQALSEDKDD